MSVNIQIAPFSNLIVAVIFIIVAFFFFGWLRGKIGTTSAGRDLLFVSDTIIYINFLGQILFFGLVILFVIAMYNASQQNNKKDSNN